MNSRGVYDEEQLRLAIEESKKDGAPNSAPGTRNNKRSRSDSDESVLIICNTWKFLAEWLTL